MLLLSGQTLVDVFVSEGGLGLGKYYNMQSDLLLHVMLASLFRTYSILLTSLH